MDGFAADGPSPSFLISFFNFSHGPVGPKREGRRKKVKKEGMREGKRRKKPVWTNDFSNRWEGVNGPNRRGGEKWEKLQLERGEPNWEEHNKVARYT